MSLWRCVRGCIVSESPCLVSVRRVLNRGGLFARTGCAIVWASRAKRQAIKTDGETKRRGDGVMGRRPRRYPRAVFVSPITPSLLLPVCLFYRVARERVGEDDDAGE